MPKVQSASAPQTAAKRTRRGKSKPSCADCYFGCRMLCALELDGPCSTFRPDSPDGLVPPTQPMLLMRSEPAQGSQAELGAAA